MRENKTRPTSGNVEAFIAAVEHPVRREDALTLLAMFNRLVQEPPRMWGPGIIGYGEYTYQTADGQSHQFMRCGFSPRKQNLSLYVKAGMAVAPHLLDALGKHKTSKACLYINKLADVDMAVLEGLIKADLEEMNRRYPV